MAWADNYNSIYESELPITEDGAKYWKFSLEEHKAKGTLHMSARIYQKAMKEGGHEMGNLWSVTGVNPENQYETHTIEARTQREAIEQFQIRYPDLAVIRSVKFVSGPRQPGGIHKR